MFMNVIANISSSSAALYLNSIQNILIIILTLIKKESSVFSGLTNVLDKQQQKQLKEKEAF